MAALLRNVAVAVVGVAGVDAVGKDAVDPLGGDAVDQGADARASGDAPAVVKGCSTSRPSISRNAQISYLNRTQSRYFWKSRPRMGPCPIVRPGPSTYGPSTYLF